MKYILPIVALLLFITSCKTTDGGKVSTSNTENRRPSAEADGTTHLSAADKQFIDTLYSEVVSRVKDPIALDSIVRTSVMLGGMGMKLMAAFDAKIEKIANMAAPTEKDMNYIKNDITCQLWESSFVQHISQDKISYIQHLILKDRNVDLYKRFLTLFISGRNDNPARALAKANILRVLKWNHENNCQLIQCPPYDVTQATHDFPFDLFSDSDMAQYYKRNRDSIGFYSNVRDAQDNVVGSCYDYPGKRKPSQAKDAVSYSWQKRSHTGSELKQNEYIITYDDGPHIEYTDKIAKTWEDSGFKLPTFFWLTQNVKRYPRIAVNLLERNFPLALHSYTHADLGNLASSLSLTKLNAVNKRNFATDLKTLTEPNFAKWKSDKLKREILSAKTEYETIINTIAPSRNFRIKHFRLPFGSGMKNTEIGNLLHQADLEHHFWAIDSLDWNDKNPLTIQERVLNQMKINKKGIILFHDLHKQSYLASIELIKHFKENTDAKVLSINDLSIP